MSTVVRRAESRRSETPNAVMTTYASAAQGGSGIALWRVEMAPGAAGPQHTFDVEQVWTVLDGAAEVALDGGRTALAAGDTLVLPAGEGRRVHADPAAGLVAIVAAPAGAQAIPDGGAPLVPDWIA